MAEHHRPRTQTDAFPWFVTLGSLCVGLWIFVTSTKDAVREKEMLDSAAQRIEARRTELLDQAVRLRTERDALPGSPDLLMREMDRAGVLPHEILPPIDESLGSEPNIEGER